MSETMETEPANSTDTNMDISPKQDGGILKEIIKEGTSDAKPRTGDTVVVHYVGTLMDGTKFDSSRDRGEKFEFELGKGAVIKGWDIGVATMKKGEIAKLTCTADYAYGTRGSPPKIPADATLIFEVELFTWKGEDLSPDKDGGIQRLPIQEGSGYEKPNEFANVKVHLIGSYEDKIFEDRDVEFVVGEADVAGVVNGIDIAIQKFKKDEKSEIVLSPNYAFGAEGNSEYNIPPNAEVKYEVTLISFEKKKESWEMDVAEKIEQSEIIKTKGTNFFKAGNYVKAKKMYKRIVDFLEQEENLEGEEKEKRNALVLAGHLNQAMCCLKLKEDTEATNECDAALQIDPKNEKGLFRRGQACMNLQSYDMALKDFKAVIEIDPNNKAAKHQVALANQKIKQAKEKDKKTFGGMFEKFAKIDAEKTKHDEDKSTEISESKSEQKSDIPMEGPTN